MRDALLLFGKIELATKDTAAYSTDVLDMNLPALQFTGRGNNVCVVFQPDADMNAADSMQPIIQDSANNSDWVTILTGPIKKAVTASTQIVLPIPLSHRRYVRVGILPTSTGTLTATDVEAWVELGK